MGIDADISFVVILSVGAPNSLEVEKVKVHVGLELLDQLYGKIVILVSKGAKLPILTLRASIEIRGAELCFVFVRMIELLNPVVRFVARVSIRALLALVNEPALL